MRKEQIAKLASELKTAKLPGILVCPSEELLFLTGFTPMMCERFQGLFINDSGAFAYVCSKLYTGEIEHAYGDTMPIFQWMDGESMTDAVSKALEKLGLQGKNIGVNSTAPAFNTLKIEEECGIHFIPATDVLEEARIIKNEEEIQNLRDSAKVADAAFSDVIKFIKPGLKEADIKDFLSARMIERGGEKTWTLVATGPNSSFSHYLGTERVIEEQDIVLLDFGCVYKGMYSDMSRMVFVGGITEEQKKIYEIVLRANKASEAAAVTGAFIPDVDAAARDIITKEGYGDNFINRVGHGIGYMIHEGPYIVKNNKRNLLPGMAFSIEPGIVLPKKFGMRVEDIVLTTESGNEILNKSSTDIIIV